MQVRPTQALPPATYALLHSLAPVHSAHFPRIARAVHADTSEYSTEAQVKEAEQKIALSKSVLGGWLQRVEADLEGGKGESGSQYSWTSDTRLTRYPQTGPRRPRT